MAIPYTDVSWNPITGCSPISAGCDHCWAAKMIVRHRGLPGYASLDPFKPTFHPERLDQPKHWRKPKVIATCFMGDWCHENVPGEWRDAVWAVMRECPQHTFIMSTKRALHMVCEITRLERTGTVALPDNVWHGISVENQKTANERVPFIEHVDHGWISCEPMLEGINWPTEFYYAKSIIVGAESGPKARPFNPEWAEATQEACKRAGVKFYMKQLPRSMGGANWDKWPDSLNHLKVRELPWKKE